MKKISFDFADMYIVVVREAGVLLSWQKGALEAWL